jgi:6-pyruvoyltetrahydropterin/6-carboxytetrahydropterin synthase
MNTAKSPSLFELRKTITFESAHRLPHLPATHKCSRMHGHSFSATLVVRGPLNPHFGWVVDYAEMKKAFAPIIEELDHRTLNEIEGLENPTSEVIARWIYLRIKTLLPSLHQVIIDETCTTECRYPVGGR